MTEVTKSAYGRMKGVSHTAINKAVETKRIVKGWNPVTGKIIVELADQEYGAVDNTQKINSAEKKQSVSLKPKSETPKPVSNQVDDSTIEQLATEEGLRPEDLKITDDDTYLDAKTKHTKVQFLLDKAKLLKLQGSLVDRVQVENTLFSYSTSLRRFLRTLPQVVSADMRAAPTDLDAQMIMLKAIDAGLERFANGVDLTSDET